MGKQQCNDELLFQHVSHGDVEAIKCLRRDGAGLEWVDKEGRTPLILACTKAELYDVATTLLDLGADVNAYRSGFGAGTPLHHAAKRGLQNTVKLLLFYGGNPMALNDDSHTPLDVARSEGYSSVVRAIEKFELLIMSSHICLFSGWMREFYGPDFLEPFAPQVLSRRVWVVIVPTGSRNHTKPFKLKLVVYASLQDAQPRTVMDLWKANLEESKSDASMIIVSTSPKYRRERRGLVSHARRWVQVNRQKRLKLAAATEGDVKQLNWFCVAQPMHPPVFMQNSKINASIQSAMDEMQTLSHETFMPNVDLISQELTPSVSPLRVVAKVEDNPNKEDGGSGLCTMCVDASYEAVCVPCGHVAGCISCLRKIKDEKLGCPFCRTNIDQVIKLYHV